MTVLLVLIVLSGFNKKKGKIFHSMSFKSFSFKWWWYGLFEDLYELCGKELHDLEEKELKKGHGWETPKEQLPYKWYSVGLESLHEYSKLLVKNKKQKKQLIMGPYHCIWESPQHVAIRCRYKGKIFQRFLSFIPNIVGILGGMLGIVSFILQLK